MPPKADPTNMTPDSTKFLLSTLFNCATVKPDWNAVAEDNGIKYGRNARSRFISVIKPFGLGLEGDKLVKLDSSQAEKGGAGAQVAAPKTPTKRQGTVNTTPSSKKMKTEEIKEEMKEEIDEDGEEF